MAAGHRRRPDPRGAASARRLTARSPRAVSPRSLAPRPRKTPTTTTSGGRDDIPHPGQRGTARGDDELTKFHREHEKFYASSPREFAVTLQRHARTLLALADQWSTTVASTRAVLSPYEGAEDLDSPAALQLDGVLFLEGEGRPGEIGQLIRDLRTPPRTEGHRRVAGESDGVLLGGRGCTDRDRRTGRHARRAAPDHCQRLASGRHEKRGPPGAGPPTSWSTSTSPQPRCGRPRRRPSLDRPSLSAARWSPRADLCSESTGLVHDNERRWRTFRLRVDQVLAAQDSTRPQEG